MLLLVLATVFQWTAAALALRAYGRHGRHWAWLPIAATAFLWPLEPWSAFLNGGGPARSLSPTEIQADGMAVLSALALAVGVALVDGMFYAATRSEAALTCEKRQLTMLVDRRVADLEAEVSERGRAEAALRRDGERFSAIITTQYDIATAELDLGVVMNLIVTRTQELTQASGAAIEMADGAELVSQVASGRAAPFVGTRTTRGLSHQCVRTGELLRCDDVERDGRVDLEGSRRMGVRSLIVVPLLHERRVIGVLRVISPEPYAFDAMDVHTLQLMAGLIGAAMSHHAEFEAKQKLLAEALERADRDPLTSLLNHRVFHNRLHEEADRAQREGHSLAVAVIDMDNFKFFNDAYGHAVGDQVLRRVAAALQGCCRSYDVLSRFGGDEFAVLMPGTGPAEAANLAQRLRECTQNIGFRPTEHDATVPISLSVGVAVFPDDAPTRLEALELADARLRRSKYGVGDGQEITETLRSQLACSMGNFSILSALVAAVDNKDRYTRRHSEDVMTYSVQIAQELGLDEETQRIVRVAALLHDVGKIGVPDAILRKPGRLSETEFRAVQQHPMMGAIIVSAVPGFEETLDTVRHHHERWDGEGYPFGLCGEETPLMARLMAVADAYSAMTTDRPYRKGMDPQKALAILEAGAGTQWDPKCVHAFLGTRRAPPPPPFAPSPVPAAPRVLAAR